MLAIQTAAIGGQIREVQIIMKSKITIAAAILFFSPFTFACDYPPRAELPNGATATKDSMLAGQKSVKAYMVEMDEYLACIDSGEKEAVAALIDPTDEELATRETAITKKHNAAVDDMELTAAKFNEQVRDYKAQGE